jgi:hypothetical protein
LNSGPHTCYAGALPLEPLLQPFCDEVFWDRVSHTIFLGLASNAILLISASWVAGITSRVNHTWLFTINFFREVSQEFGRARHKDSCPKLHYGRQPPRWSLWPWLPSVSLPRCTRVSVCGQQHWQSAVYAAPRLGSSFCFSLLDCPLGKISCCTVRKGNMWGNHHPEMTVTSSPPSCSEDLDQRTRLGCSGFLAHRNDNSQTFVVYNLQVWMAVCNKAIDIGCTPSLENFIGQLGSSGSRL